MSTSSSSTEEKYPFDAGSYVKTVDISEKKKFAVYLSGSCIVKRHSLQYSSFARRSSLDSRRNVLNHISRRLHEYQILPPHSTTTLSRMQKAQHTAEEWGLGVKKEIGADAHLPLVAKTSHDVGDVTNSSADWNKHLISLIS